MSNQKLFTGDHSKVMVIRKISENITTLSVPFKRFGVVKFGGRGTIGGALDPAALDHSLTSLNH